MQESTVNHEEHVLGQLLTRRLRRILKPNCALHAGKPGKREVVPITLISTQKRSKIHARKCTKSLHSANRFIPGALLKLDKLVLKCKAVSARVLQPTFEWMSTAAENPQTVPYRICTYGGPSWQGLFVFVPSSISRSP